YRVEAQVAPQLQPDFIANVAADRRIETARRQHGVKAFDARRARAGRFSDRKFSAMLVPNDARRDDFRRGKHDAAHRSLRAQMYPLHAAGIDAGERETLKGDSVDIKKPVWKAVACGNDRRRVAEERQHRRNGVGNRMRLERDKDVVLSSEA